MSGWVGVDLDGTLAHHHPSYAPMGIVGPPVPVMLTRVKIWLKHGVDVRIFTARATGEDAPKQIEAIHAWCARVGLPALTVTATKDYQMIELWDDRAVRVQTNTGMSMTADPRINAIRYVPGEV